MTTEHDDLTNVIFEQDMCQHKGDARDVAAAILAAGYVKASPKWEPSLENGGVYEYTTTGSCDGKESWHWKRKPQVTYDSGYFPWEKNETKP